MDGRGNAYVNGGGFDLMAGEPFAPGIVWHWPPPWPCSATWPRFSASADPMQRALAPDERQFSIGVPAYHVALATCASRQPHLQLEHPPGRVVHITHGQAEPVPEKPEPFTAGPGDQFFGALRLVIGGMGVVHGSSWEGVSGGGRSGCSMARVLAGSIPPSGGRVSITA